MTLSEMLAMADQATQGVEINTDFELIPPGTYDVAITGVSDKPVESSKTNPTNPAEHGKYIRIECTITGPSHAGRKLWMNNNIICFPKTLAADDVRKCQTAMAIGAKERKVMLDSIGKTGIQRTIELVGATFKASVIVEKGTDGYKDKNVIKSIKPMNAAASAPVAAPSVAPAPAPAAAPARAKMPWEK